MDFKQYKEKMQSDITWMPGKEEIDKCIKQLYGKQKPELYAPEMLSQTDDDIFLDGISVYKSANQTPHRHIITYGMSNLYADDEAFGQDYNGWGYEMTMRIADDGSDNFDWALELLENMAEYTNTGEDAWFEVNEFVDVDDESFDKDSKSKIKAFLIVNDPELNTIETVHGKLEFLLLVGITGEEVAAIEKNEDNLKLLIERMRKENHLFITDLNREKSYI